jgi:hypothetical protein
VILYFGGPGKSMYTFSVTFRFPLPARLQWVKPAGEGGGGSRKQKTFGGKHIC